MEELLHINAHTLITFELQKKYFYVVQHAGMGEGYNRKYVGTHNVYTTFICHAALL